MMSFHIPKDAVFINQGNLNTGIVHKESNLIYSGYYWHKIYVQNAQNYERDFVLRTLMNAVQPLDFIPVCYTSEGENVSFLLKNCGAAINELCRLNLIVPHPDFSQNLPPFKISILLKHAHAAELKIEIQQNICGILKRRYNSTSKTLNLEAFYKDPDLLEFCPLSQPKLMYFLLHLSRELDMENIILSNNDIELLKPFEALFVEKGLTSIDLRNNNIKRSDQIALLQPFAISELYLEGNPFCENISEYEYMQLVRSNCPKVVKLDGFILPPTGMFTPRRNFICNAAGVELVDQFMDHYFTLFDSHNRNILESLYHKEATLSMSCLYLSGQSTSNSCGRLAEFKKVARNFKTISDLSKLNETLYCGPAQIIRVLRSFPTIEHDPYSFTVDVTNFAENSIILTVTGVFRVCPEKLLDPEQTFSFMRTFVLLEGVSREYKIVNEQWHVSNASSSQHSKAFKVVRVQKPAHISLAVPKNISEEQEMMNAVSLISSLKPEWAKKCLSQTGYDLKKTLNLFVDLYKVDKIPQHAFRIDLMEMESAKNFVKKAKIENTSSNTGLTKEKTDAANLAASDPIVKAALQMNFGLPKEEALCQLREAVDVVIKKYTYAVKQYRLLGREFYKFGLLTEARQFLNEAMEELPKNMGEEIYSTFTLFELQFGDWTVAENMVAITAQTYPVVKSTKFIGEHIAKINLGFARKMFEFVVNLPLSSDKMEALKVAHAEFNDKYASQIEETRVQEEVRLAEQFEIKKQREERDEELRQKKLKNLEEKRLRDAALEEQKVKVEVKLESMEEENIKFVPSMEEENIIVPKYEDADKMNAELVYNAQQRIEDEENLHLKYPFSAFRKKMFIKAGIFSTEIEYPELNEFLKMQDKSAIIAEGQKLIGKFECHYKIFKGVCDKLWNSEMFIELHALLTDAKITARKLENLRTFYAVRHELREYGMPVGIVIERVANADLISIVNLFEYLQENEPKFTGVAFVACIKCRDIDETKQRLLVLLFRCFAKETGDVGLINKADYFALRYYHKIYPFHVIMSLQCKKAKQIYEDFLSYHRNTMSAEELHRKINLKFSKNWEIFAQVLHGLYYHGQIKSAHKFIKAMRAKYKENNELEPMELLVVYFEKIYGDESTALATLENINPDINQYCVKMYMNVADGYLDVVRNMVEVITNDIYEVTNPDVQDTVYMYYCDFMNTFNVDIFELQ